MAKQLTRQGIGHAQVLGGLLRDMYVTRHQLVAPGCPAGEVGLESDPAQKNQITVQVWGGGLCYAVCIIYVHMLCQ